VAILSVTYKPVRASPTIFEGTSEIEQLVISRIDEVRLFTGTDACG